MCAQVTAVTSELSDERFRSDAVGQTLDVEKAERLRLSRENKELQVGPLVEKVICKLKRLQESFEKGSCLSFDPPITSLKQSDISFLSPGSSRPV